VRASVVYRPRRILGLIGRGARFDKLGVKLTLLTVLPSLGESESGGPMVEHEVRGMVCAESERPKSGRLRLRERGDLLGLMWSARLGSPLLH